MVRLLTGSLCRQRLVQCTALLGFLFCVALQSRAQDAVYGGSALPGNKFGYGSYEKEHVTEVVDPITGQSAFLRKRIQLERPETLNGKKVYPEVDVTNPRMPHAKGKPLQDYLITGLSDFLAKALLNNGDFIRIDLSDLVLNDKGKLVYYRYEGIKVNHEGIERSLADNGINTLLEQLMLDMPAMTPAMVDGKPVPVLLGLQLVDYKVTMNNGEIGIEQ